MAIYSGQQKEYRQAVDSVLALSRAMDHERARALADGRLAPLHEALHASMDHIMDFNHRGAGLTGAQAAATFQFGWQIVTLLLIVLVLLGAVVVVVVRKELVQPLRRLTDTLAALASGKAMVEITDRERHDEIGHMAQSVLELQKAVVAQELTGWVKASSSEILTRVQRQEHLVDFARQLMAALTPTLGSQVGGYYH